MSHQKLSVVIHLSLAVGILVTLGLSAQAQEIGSKPATTQTQAAKQDPPPAASSDAKSDPASGKQGSVEADKPVAPLSAADKRKAEIAKLARLAARRKGEYTFDDLKFDIEKGGDFDRKMLAEEIESFNKKTIRIRGYMFPTFQQSGIQEFVLVRDNQECCFGPGAAIFDCIRVKMAKGKTTKYSVRPIAVKGKFEIEEFRLPDGYLAAIYKITAVEVK